jgi:hypothetical protein
MMGKGRRFRTALQWSAAAVGFAATAYATYVGVAWLRYGGASRASDEEADALLDRFMPDYEVAERHHIHVAAPAEITFAAACETDLMQSPIIRAVFRARELILGSQPDSAEHPRGVLAYTTSLGWRVLANVPGREVVMGAVTQPWDANVVFRSLTADQFVAFNEPDYVKIAWTLRADPAGPNASIFRHETRVMTTDLGARVKFRRYWSCFSPGIKLIRCLLLVPLRNEAERRTRDGGLHVESCPL